MGRVLVALCIAAGCGIAQPQIHSQGTLKVHEGCGVDLDNGEVPCMVTVDGDPSEPPSISKSAAFSLQRDRQALLFKPHGRGRLALGGSTAVGKTGCDSAELSKKRVRIDSLPIKTHACVRTAAGRIAEMQLDAIESGRNSGGLVQISYVTWER